MTPKERALDLINLAEAMMGDPNNLALRGQFARAVFNLDRLAESILLLATDKAELELRRSARFGGDHAP